jgi:endonuclease/exonuclease/phosphatase (EEP) superfamily protein YafD
MSYPGKIAGVFALALAGTLPGVAPAQALPDTSDNRIQVIQHNPDAQGPGPAMQAAADWDGGVDAITFQELCKSQVPQLEAAGYRVLWRQQRARTSSSCRKGNAIASVHVFSNTSTYELLTRGTGGQRRVFKLLCADLRGTGVARTTVCTSHFPLDYNGKKAPTGTRNRIVVANKIRDIVNRKISAGRRVVLTGDFNDSPKSAPLDRFYRVKGSGRFWEGDQRCSRTAVCRAMSPTTSGGRALDYFFASSPGVNKLTGVSKLVAKEYDTSGHHVIRGAVKFGALR